MDVVWNQTKISPGLYRALVSYTESFSTPIAQDTYTVYACMFAPQNLKTEAKNKRAFYSKESTLTGMVNELKGAEYNEYYIQVRDLVGEIKMIKRKNPETIKFLAIKDELVDIFEAHLKDENNVLDMKEIVRFFNIIACSAMIQKRFSMALKPRGLHKDGGPQTKRMPQLYDFGSEPSSIARIIPNSFKAPGALFDTYSKSIKRSAKGPGLKKKEDNEAKMVKQFAWWFGGNVNMIKQLATRPVNKENRRGAESMMVGMCGNINKHTPICFPSTVTLRAIRHTDKTLRDLIVNSIDRAKEPYIIGNLWYSCERSEYNLLNYLIDTGFIFDNMNMLMKCTNYGNSLTLDDFMVIKNGKTGMDFTLETFLEPLRALLFPEAGSNSGIKLNQGQTIYSNRGGATSSKDTANFSRNAYLSLIEEFRQASSFLPVDPYLSNDTANLKETPGKVVKVEDFMTVVEIPYVDGGFLTNVKPVTNLKKVSAEEPVNAKTDA